MSKETPSVEQLRALWQAETGPAGRRACWAALCAGVITAVLVGRLGQDWARAGAAALVLLGVAPAIFRAMVLRRRERDARAVLAATILQTEPELGRAAARALQLTARTTQRPETGSPELAQLHLAKLLGRAALDPIARRANWRAWRWTLIGLSLALGSFALVVGDPFRMVEGLDVLAATDGVAPIPVRWVNDQLVTAEPPAYLDLPRHSLRPRFPSAVHAGTQLIVRVRPLHPGRTLVLSDGKRQVPLTADGRGGLVGRWLVLEDAPLAVAARFGSVLIYEPERLEVHAIEDQKPVVRLAGAPNTVHLLKQPRIAVHWEASDDHGLREVALVLKAGERQQRRRLSKPQGGVRSDRGGIDLLASDKFLRRSYVPVELTVEALDADPVTGPKWGRSEPIVIIPPQVGELEALRYRALKRGRDGVIDLLAARLKAPDQRTEEQARAHQEARALLNTALDSRYGELRLSGRIAAMVRGQLEKLDQALHAKTKAKKGKSPLEITEQALLAIDSALAALGHSDTRSASLKLAEVAADAAAAIRSSLELRERARAARRLAAALEILRGGGKHFVQLGALGEDIGEIIENGLRRIRRAWGKADRLHAELAAEDLAARLRRPDPSFRSAGSGRGRGTEAGGQPQPGQADASNAAKQAKEIEDALQQLRREHAAEMAGVEQALRQAVDPKQREALRDKLRKQAKSVRRAVNQLPKQASSPGSSRAKAAQARSQAEGMAAALEQGNLEAAAEQGQRAMRSLEQARRAGRTAAEGSGESEVGQRAGDAKRSLGSLVKQAQKQLEELQRQASEAAAPALEKAARREKSMAEQARAIRERSASSEAPLPQRMLEHLGDAASTMEGAAKSLREHRGARGNKQQRKAQRLLEMSLPEREQARGNHSEGNAKQFAQQAEVPGESRDEAADRFRKRVTKGLGNKSPPHLREAIRRYTEGLLR